MRSSSSALLGAGVVVCAVVAPACVGSGGDGAGDVAGIEAVASALGQPNGDYPSYDERVVLYATNRARMNPAAEGSWPTAYTAQPPLQWNVDLNHSSRAHSLDMRDTPCFQHPSCGSATDDTFTRVRSFYTATARSLGENIVAGVADGRTAVTNWINEIGAAAGETGHRDNIFSTSFQLLGVGYAAGGTAFRGYWTQDFVGTGGALALPRMTDGIHFPATVAAGGSVSFGTTYYDAGGAAPSRIAVVVDGTCAPLALASTTRAARGTAGKGAYEATVALADGCHAYYFLATAGGTDVTYPDSGALQVGVGTAANATTCPLFATTRPATVTCDTPITGAGGSGGTTGAAGSGGTGAAGSGGTGAGGMGGGAGGSGPGGTTGAAGTTGSGGSPATGGTTGGAGTAGGAGAGGGGGSDLTGATGGCSCDVSAPNGGGWLAVLALGALVVRKRRVVRSGQRAS